MDSLGVEVRREPHAVVGHVDGELVGVAAEDEHHRPPPPPAGKAWSAAFWSSSVSTTASGVATAAGTRPGRRRP